VMVTIALCAACDDDAVTPPLEPALAGAYQGTWTGQTSQFERFGFVVTGNQVTRADFNVSYSDTSCSGGLSTGTIGPLASISNTEFAATYLNPSGVLTWSVAGTFASATIATGTLQVATTPHVTPTGPVSACSVNARLTWTAQKGA
jgi:hypothetical protein